MGVRQYNLGKKHGQQGIRALAHRKLRPYDGASDQRSYINGYSEGYKERLSKSKTLDYSKPLNNQVFLGE